jgi:hypothetical protein
MNQTGHLLRTVTCIIDGFGEISLDVVDRFVAHDYGYNPFFLWPILCKSSHDFGIRPMLVAGALAVK